MQSARGSGDCSVLCALLHAGVCVLSLSLSVTCCLELCFSKKLLLTKVNRITFVDEQKEE